MKKLLLACYFSIALSACVSNPERGIFGLTQYLQQVVNGVLVWEYAVPAGNISCEQNAWQNNKDAEGKLGYYKCSSSPAPAAALPFSFVAQSTLGPSQGYRSSNPTTIRVLSSAQCWNLVASLKTQNQILISEACGKKPNN